MPTRRLVKEYDFVNYVSNMYQKNDITQDDDIFVAIVLDLPFSFDGIQHTHRG
jgi:hypothetical protein